MKEKVMQERANMMLMVNERTAGDKRAGQAKLQTTMMERMKLTKQKMMTILNRLVVTLRWQQQVKKMTLRCWKHAFSSSAFV